MRRIAVLAKIPIAAVPSVSRAGTEAVLEEVLEEVEGANPGGASADAGRPDGKDTPAPAFEGRRSPQRVPFSHPDAHRGLSRTGPSQGGATDAGARRAEEGEQG